MLRPRPLPLRFVTHGMRWRPFSSAAAPNYQYRTSYEHFTPIKYDVDRTTATANISGVTTDLIVLPFHHDAKCPPSSISDLPSFAFSLDDANRETVNALLRESGFFEAQSKDSKFRYVVARSTKDNGQKILAVSLGAPSSANSSRPTANRLMRSDLIAARGLCRVIHSVMAENKSFRSCSILFPNDCAVPVQSIVESLNLCQHSDGRFKASAAKSDERALNVSIRTASNDIDLSDALSLGECVGSGVRFARELVDAPANVLTPSRLSESAQSLASDTLKIEILDEFACAALKMHSFLSVGACSENRPVFIHCKLSDSKKEQ